MKKQMIRILKLNQIRQEEKYCNYIIDYTYLEKDEMRFYRLEKDIINQLPSKSKVKNLLKLIEYEGN